MRNMQMNILIIESPGKQKTIQKILGSNWKVAASLGHIRGLEKNVKFLKNNYEPAYEFLKEKAQAIKTLKEESKGCEVYLGADKDYEGEQIAYSVCLLLKLNPKTTKRVTFTEITEKAIKAAIDAPGIIDMNRVNTQKTRAMLDIMIGFTMSPLLWKHVGPSLSAGRCQTPALRLVVEREDQITNFKTSSSWQLTANWTKNGFNFVGHMEELEDEESALNYMESIPEEGTIISKDIRPWSEKHPEPLITSTLQQQASAMFGLNPKETMRIAQQLYEAGHITYMRTDKAVISEDAAKEAREWVATNYGEEFVEESKSKSKSKSKSESKSELKGSNAQEAHEAIRPTHMDVVNVEMEEINNKLYKIIWQRTIQSVMSAAKGETCKIKINLEDCIWSAQWKRTTFEGWKKAGKIAKIDEEEDSTDWEKGGEGAWEKGGEGDWQKAINLEGNVKWLTMNAQPKDTKAKSRYTEATLVRELEKLGIGRPSTFASLLSTIQKKYVVCKNIPAKEVMIKEYNLKPNCQPESKNIKKKIGAEKNKLVPTDLGRSVLQFMLKHFNDLFDYKFTSEMEKKLDRIDDNWKDIIKNMWESYKERYDNLSENGANGANASNGPNGIKSRDFKGIKAIQSKKGPLLLIEGLTKEDTKFLGWPEGVAFEDMTEEIALQFKEAKETITIGEWNGQPIIKKDGKFGAYLQCGDVSITYQEETFEQTIERFDAKKTTKKFKDYVIRTGKYGPYIMKTSLKKPKFVSLPKGIDPNTLTEKEVEVIYNAQKISDSKTNSKFTTETRIKGSN